MLIRRLDHLVLTVAEIDKTVSFYRDVLGMEEVVSGSGRKAMHFGEQKINLHQQGKKFEPKAEKPTPGSADLCFITDSEPFDLISELKEKGIEPVAGPVQRTGALGEMDSVYFRDPDGNLIEVSRYRG